jgi:hypothetical protein
MTDEGLWKSQYLDHFSERFLNDVSLKAGVVSGKIQVKMSA